LNATACFSSRHYALMLLPLILQFMWVADDRITQYDNAVIVLCGWYQILILFNTGCTSMNLPFFERTFLR